MISFGLTSDWMKKWREFLSQSCSVVDTKPINFRRPNESALFLNENQITSLPDGVVDPAHNMVLKHGRDSKRALGKLCIFTRPLPQKNPTSSLAG